MPVADILTFAVALVLIVRTYKEIGSQAEKLSGITHFQVETR